MLWSMGLQRAGHDLATEWNRTEHIFLIMYNFLQRGLAYLLLDLFTDFGIFEVIINSNISDIFFWLVFRSSMLFLPPTSLLNLMILIVYL